VPNFIRILALIASFVALGSNAQAETKAVDVTVSYRERIALPPDARLDVQLLDVSRTDVGAQRMSAQRFAMDAVPMTVSLTYDPRLIAADGNYVVVAGIWSGDRQIFQTTERHPAFAGGAVDILLRMVGTDADTTPPNRTLVGIQWAVTEVFGQPWGNDDPATLAIDPDGHFSMFGGCNRFNGELARLDRDIHFPENFAGTLMACPEEVEALERRFLDAVRQVSHFVRYGGGLVMMDTDGNAVLHFVERPE
jgi:putative lipoprotein